MQLEFDALFRNHKWTLVPPPLSKNIKGNKCVFSIKKAPNLKSGQKKSRVIAKGFSHKHGFDFS